MNAIVRYEEMRVAVERCARIDEAAELRDKAAALQAYARQRDDRELDVWTSEIKLRASVRIGELVRELDTAQKVGPRSDVQLPSGGKSKTKAITDAGLTKSDAYRYQELAGPRDQQAQTAGKAGRADVDRRAAPFRKASVLSQPLVQRSLGRWGLARGGGNRRRCCRHL